jgi:amino acid adenylation domain-containing protein
MEYELNKRIAALSADKIKMLVQKAAKEGHPLSLGKVKRQPRDGKPFPMSYSQERLWFLCQLAPNSIAYHNPLAARLITLFSFDLDILERSLNEIVRRHEILRTTFDFVGGQFCQVIASELHLKISYQDLRQIQRPLREAEAIRIASLENQQPFNLNQGPLLRFKVLHLEDTEYILLIMPHHIISDGWSNGVFIRELAVLYAAFSENRSSPLPEPDLQYADYAVWQREWLQGERLHQLLTYWRQHLSGEIPPLRLPTDYPYPTDLSFSGSIETLTLPVDLTQSIKALSVREGATLFMTMLAAFKVLLYRYTGQLDLVVGSPVANRNRKEFENGLGLFVNTLALRTSVTGHSSFQEFLKQVRQVCQQAFMHQELPFEKLVEELHPQRNLASHPFFQALFVLQNAPLELEYPGVSVHPLKIDYGTSKFELTLWLEETDQHLLLSMTYRKDLFKSDTIRRMLTHYQTLLAGIVANPNQRISHFPLLPNEETHILMSWNRIGRMDIPNECFHQRFMAQVTATPNNVAVVCPQQQLTYAELNAKANQLARYLQRYGVAPEVTVGLLMDRSVSMIIGLLGILKAGGAYVPLDSALPKQRLTYILEDSQASVLVTEGRFQGTISHPNIKTVCMDMVWSSIAQEDSSDIDTAFDSDTLAYVIYTSGTTGSPKGIGIEHRQLMHYIDAIWAEMGLSPGARFAALSTLATDLGNTTIFPPLCNGGSVVIVPYDLVFSPEQLASYFKQNQIDCVKLVPSHLSALLDSSCAEDILPQKLLILGGEAAPYALIDQLQRLSPCCRILNHYGPTETTVGVLTYHVPSSDTSVRNTYLPLGHPISNTQVYVLDAHLQPLPIGVSGEIYIGGEGLARGYLNQPSLTAEKFIPNPFAATKGACLYKTGDKGRYLPDGNIEFLGRIDRQVKYRGFRIELQGIEAVLAEHPEVLRAIVLIPKSDTQQRLIAYLLLRKQGGTTEDELRIFLQAKLPNYMIPNSMVFLDWIPLTLNGKVDYGALPTVFLENPKRRYTAPRDAVELELTKIWGSVLEVEDVSISDNFFDLGGHSLLAVRLMTRIEEVFGQYLPLTVLFEHGTIEYLAHMLRKSSTSLNQSPIVTIQSKGSRPPLFFVHPAGGNVLCYYDLARYLRQDRPFYGLQVPMFGKSQVVHTSIQEMAKHYLKAVTEVSPRGPYLLGGWSMGGVVAFEMAQQLIKRGQEVPFLAILDQRAPAAEKQLDPEFQNNDAMQLALFVHKAELLIGKPLVLSYEDLRDRDTEEQARLCLERFKANELVPSDTELPYFRNFLEVQKAHNLATARYVPEIYSGTVVLFRSQEPLPKEETFKDASEFGNCQDPTLGWQRYVSNPIEIQPVPGNHITMMTSPHVQVLAEKLKDWVVQINGLTVY